MSSPDGARAIVLSRRARQDFIDILRYTGGTWGLAQLRSYRSKIDEALRLIGANPGLGHRSPDLPDTHWLYFVGSHVIVYRERQTDIAVVRLLHQRMSLRRHA